MTKPRITLAALGALSAGDMENFIVAATPGGIEAQEAAGQRQLVQSSVLPKECPRAELEAMGIVFGADVDDLFISVTLPVGWTKQPTDHHMWSDLLDEKGRTRAAIFYKAAFYDRRAFAQTTRCVIVTRRWYDDTQETDAAVVSADAGVLFETGRVAQMNYKDTDAIEKEAHAWADAHYPNRADPLAYWA